MGEFSFSLETILYYNSYASTYTFLTFISALKLSMVANKKLSKSLTFRGFCLIVPTCQLSNKYKNNVVKLMQAHICVNLFAEGQGYLLTQIL